MPVAANIDDSEVDRAHELRVQLYGALGEGEVADTVNRLNQLLAHHGASLSLVADDDGGWQWELSAPSGAGPVAQATVEAAAGVLAVIRELGAGPAA